MDRQLLLEQVQNLNREGKSIRAIAADLGVHPSRVQRALKFLGRRLPDESVAVSAKSNSLLNPGTGSFVGRKQEIDELKTALEDAISGRGRLVMLAGEPGIGKTRIAQELATHAHSRGAQVMWGWCYEEAGAPPYGPWVQSIRSYTQQTDPEKLRSILGPGAADIAEIIVEVKDILTDLPSPLSLEPEQARFRLFDSITTMLQNASQSQPIILFLEDIQWADKPSLLLLQFLARRLGESCLLVVGTYRNVELSRQHPLIETLAQLAREPVFRRELIQGLIQEETEQFIGVIAGVPLPPELGETIYRRTEGNPFFIKEVVRLWKAQGDLKASSVSFPGQSVEPEGIRIPEGVREVICQRLNHLSEQCNQMLATASIIGREFDFKLLNPLSEGISQEQLLQVIDEALQAGLIEELTGRMDRYQFSHALIQETLAAELSTSRRVRLHARIGEALENAYGANVAVHAAELAYHFAEGQPQLGPDKLAHYSLLAGEQALAAYAWEDAITQFQRGLEAKGKGPMDTETAELLLGLGRAQFATLERYRLHEARNTVRPAFDYYLEKRDVLKALAVAEYGATRLKGVSGGVQLLTEALNLVEPDSHQAGKLLVHYGRALYSELADYDGATESLNRAMDIAQREDDHILSWMVLSRLASIQLSHSNYQESLRNSLRAIELGGYIDQHQLMELQEGPHWEAARALLALGDIESAVPHAAAHLDIAIKRRDRFTLAQAYHLNEALAYCLGHFEAAREFSNQGLDVDHQDIRLLNNRAILEYQVGEIDQGDAYLDRLVDVMYLTPPGPVTVYSIAPLTIGMAARITGKASHFDTAAAAAKTVLSSPSVTPLYATSARIGLALLAVEQCNVVAAEEQYAALKPWSSTTSPLILLRVDRVLGLLAQIMSNLDQAIAHFEDSMAFCRKAGYRPELAWTCCDYAEALLHRNGSGDRENAISQLDEALTISRKLGMQPLIVRAVALQEQAKFRPGNPPEHPAGLTPREVEVLRLLASGMTNVGISKELMLSTRTVERHVSNIYVKTNSHNRTEATNFAFTHGLRSSS